MAKISLRKALQQKNILVGKIKETRALISSKNSYVEGTPEGSLADVRFLLTVENGLTSKLVNLKSSITVANIGIYRTLCELEEAKSYISYLCGIHTREGAEEIGYGDRVKTVKHVAQITESEIRALKVVEAAKIEALQEAVDEYNARTTIEYDL
jgi:hypothetical protein